MLKKSFIKIFGITVILIGLFYNVCYADAMPIPAEYWGNNSYSTNTYSTTVPTTINFYSNLLPILVIGLAVIIIVAVSVYILVKSKKEKKNENEDKNEK